MKAYFIISGSLLFSYYSQDFASTAPQPWPIADKFREIRCTCDNDLIMKNT